MIGLSVAHPLLADPPEVEQSEEARNVHRWRREQLCKAGYPVALAVILADDTSVDLHQAVDLLKHGCPVPTAARILGWPV